MTYPTYEEVIADPLRNNRLDRLELRDNREALYECRCGAKIKHVAGLLKSPELPPDGHPRAMQCKCGFVFVRVG